MKKRIKKTSRKINEKAVEVIKELEHDIKKESRLAAIQALIPLGLKAVEAELQAEIMELVGARYSRGNGEVKRWGSNPGSVFLGDQKVKITVPRARNIVTKEEVGLWTHERLQSAQMLDDMALSRVIHGSALHTKTRKLAKSS